MVILEMFGISPLIVGIFTVIVVVIFIAIIAARPTASSPDETKQAVSTYRYTKKDFLISRAEHEFYDALNTAVSADYYIFAQIQLPSLLDHKVEGQNRRGALAHINRKSVDFVLCDKSYISPVLAIELDDKSHLRDDRRERDIEVERILAEAGLPLLRIENHGSFDPNTIADQIRNKLATV